MVDALASTNHDVGAVRSQDVAVLFTDIVGFTQFAERNTPEDVMDLLRNYHAFVERAIFENDGTLEKYIGDGVMATFGRPETTTEDAANAIRAAKQIMSANEIFQQSKRSRGQGSRPDLNRCPLRACNTGRHRSGTQTGVCSCG